MRRIALTYILLSIIGIMAAWAQTPLRTMNGGTTLRDQYGNQIDPSTQPDNLDSTDVEVQSIPPKLYMWQVSNLLGDRKLMPADTASLNFQNTNLVEGMTGHYNYLGNLGSPRLSRLFFERRNDEPTMFLEPFSSFYFRPEEARFTNSNVPYTNLTYYKAGNKVNGEERFKSYFSVNANKRLAFGFNVDYLYGRGYYLNQSTAYFNGGLFASYIGDKYQMHAVYNNFHLKMNENGGITDDRYITHPEEMEDPGGTSYIPVNLEQTSNRNHDFYVYLTHRYRLGFNREVTKIEETKERIYKDYYEDGMLAIKPLTQTGLVIALYFGLCPEGTEKAHAEKLVQMIHDNDDKLTTGFLGTPYLLHVLTDYGYSDLAYTLLFQTKMPSWLFSVEHGATTMWEHWDGVRDDGTLWSPSMNSYNHYAYGAVGDWLYGVAAGIDTDEERPGFEHIRFRPTVTDRLDYLKASLKTKYGIVASEWRHTDKGIEYTFTVPSGISATATINGQQYDFSEGVHTLIL